MRVFDAHEDIWTHVAQKRLIGETDVFKTYHLENHMKGNVKSGIFVIWIDPPFTENPMERLKVIVREMKAEIKESREILQIVKSYEDYESALKRDVIGAVIGLEGLSYITDSLSPLDELYAIGARHASLTWNEENALATGVRGSAERGLTALGRQAIKKMENLKMIVDVSHANERTFWDIMSKCSRPIIASHSNAKAMWDHPRNLTDPQLKAIKETGGVVGVNSYPAFVSQDRNLEGLANQVDYLVNKIGIDHVGCGFDFCDYLDWEKEDKTPNVASFDVLSGLESTIKVPTLFSKLRSMGYSEQALTQIAHGNFERLLKGL
ncbi:dipeptidase [Fusibacter sp. 3D3]|uniref:dipeptidase n=1 Tax=Fusibacter sp. 3D3 TaxID=1048380 RepID=UPI000853C8B7|nr:membrane dipeptidase [Fusibacter sp. 3D3]GAU77809.1 microsomal dipeptidase [Fusibacter sp. 3D3]